VTVSSSLGITGPLDSAGAAAYVGVSLATWWSYGSRGTRPEPDIMLGRAPHWLPKTLDRWVAERPGRGTRPAKAPEGPHTPSS
jgi:predicted DNA-binding transcriptional regulator AlpA